MHLPQNQRIAMVILLAALVILVGCGQQVLVLDTDRYTPQDPILGALPGDPQGDSILWHSQDIECHDVRIIFFPTTLSTPGTGLSIPPGCSITLNAANHQFIWQGNNTKHYRISWIGQGGGGPEQVVVTLIYAGVVDNSKYPITITQDGVRCFTIRSPPTEPELAVLEGFGDAHRISLDVTRHFAGLINLRAESFDEGTLLNDAIEVSIRKPHPGLNLTGINFNVPDTDISPYFIR